MKKALRPNKIALFLVIFAGFLFFSGQAHAFFDVIPSMASMGLDALDFIDRIIGYLYYLLMLALGASIFITFSAGFLDWASTLPVGLDNSLVQSGWQFLAGFANIIFILIFVFIAFSYILRLETWGMKKALPRLIAVAFLLNFSMLFVKMFVDVGFLVQNAFKHAFFGDAGLAAPVAALVGTKLTEVVGLYGITFATFYGLALIPFLNVARSVLFATTMLSSQAFFGTFTQTILLTVFGYVGGLIFFIYGLLFLARIIVIWLLAIAAPLAFAAFILPQTQKYFSQWLQALFQWTFLGVVVFFLMGLGLKLFGAVTPPSLVWQLRGFDFVAGYTQFIFLILYLVIVFSVAKKFTPAAASAVWSVGGMAVGAGTGFLAAKAGQLATRGRLMESGWEEKRTEARMAPLKAKEAAGTITAKERIQLGKWTGRFETAQARTQVLKGLQIQEQRNKLAGKIKGMDEETAKAWLSAEAFKHSTSLRTPGHAEKSSALMEILAEKNALKDEHKNLYKEAWKNAGPDDLKKNRVKRAVLSNMPMWATDEELEEMKPKWSTGTIEKWSNSSKEDDRIIKTVVDTLRPDLITRLGASTSKASEKVQIEIDKTIGEDWRNLVNKTTDINKLTLDQKKTLLKKLEAIRYFHHSTFGETATWKKYGSMDKKDPDSVDKFIKGLRGLIK